MTTITKRKRIGWMGWTLIILAALIAVLFGLYRYTIATNGVAVLDWADRMSGGTAGTKVALHDIAYGPLPAQQLEVIVPATPAIQQRPVVVFIYGGGWHSGKAGEYHFIGRTLARAGYVVVLPGYRLTPDGVFPNMLRDGAAALKWVHDHIAEQGGDPDRVFVMGHSAGAYNGMMLTLDRQWLGREGLPDGFIKGMIGLAGPYDFYPFTSSSARAAFAHVAKPAITQPITFARGDAPPMLLLTGDIDITVKPRNSLALAKAMSAAGAPTRAVVLNGLSHQAIIMKLAQPFMARDRRVIDAVLGFLSSHSGQASAPVQAPQG